MATTAELLVLIRADVGQAALAVQGLEANFKAFNSVASAALPASLALAAAGGAIVAGFGAATQAAAHFDTSMVAIRNNTMMTTADADLMRQTVLKLGAESGAPLDKLGQGFMHITNLGFSAKDSVQILDAAMKSAVSTGGDTAATADILAQAMHEFGIPASRAAETMDMLHTAAAEGNMTLEQFSQSFGVLAAWAAAVGVPLDEAAAAMSAMTRHGFNASQAATQVKDEIAHLINPSALAKKAIEGLGNSIGKDLSGVLSPAEIQAKGLTGVINEIKSAMDLAGLSVADQTAMWLKIIPNMKGGAAGFVLAGRGADDFAAILSDMHAKLGVTDEAFARMKDTAGFQWNVLTTKFQEMGIAVGSALLPPLLLVADAVSTLVSGFLALPTPIQAVLSYVGVSIGALLALAGAIGVAAWMGGQLAVGFGAISAATTAVTGGWTAAAVGVATLATAEGVAGGAATAGAVQLEMFSVAEVATGNAAVVATAGVGGLRGALFALAGSGVAVFALLGGMVYAFSQPLRDALDTLYKLRDAANAIPDAAMNPAQRLVRDALNKLPGQSTSGTVAAVPNPDALIDKVSSALPATDKLNKAAATEANNAAEGSLKKFNEEADQRKNAFEQTQVAAETELLRLKIAQSAADLLLIGYTRQIEDLTTAANDRKRTFDLEHIDAETNVLNLKLQQSIADAQLVTYQRQLEDFTTAANERKIAFDLAHTGAETEILSLKLDQTAADQATLEYKRQIEDLDRNAIDFARKRLELDEQDAITKAKMAEQPLKNQADDLTFEAHLLKAQAKATRASGGHVDSAALHAQLRDIKHQQIADEPGLLIAQHNVALAERAKSGTDLSGALDTTSLNRAKLGVQESAAPAELAAVNAKRASEDAQHLLDLDKQKFALEESGYARSKLLIEQAMAPVQAAATVAKRIVEDAQRAIELDKQRFAITEAGYTREKLLIEQAMAPVAAAATAAKRAVEDQTRVLGLAKDLFQLTEQQYALQKLVLEAAAKKTALDLWTIEHPVAAARAPASTAPASAAALPDDRYRPSDVELNMPRNVPVAQGAASVDVSGGIHITLPSLPAGIDPQAIAQQVYAAVVGAVTDAVNNVRGGGTNVTRVSPQLGGGAY